MKMLEEVGITARQIDQARRAGMLARGVESAMRGHGIQVEREQRRRMDAIIVRLMQRGCDPALSAGAWLALMSTSPDRWDDILRGMAQEDRNE